MCRRSGVFIVNFEQILQCLGVFIVGFEQVNSVKWRQKERRIHNPVKDLRWSF